MDTLADVTTLTEMLARRTNASGKKTAFTFDGQPCSFQELWQGVNQFASFLMEKGISRGECVLVSLPNGADFFVAFYGIQLAGGIAVPMFPESGLARISSLAKLCAARLAVMQTRVVGLEGVQPISVAESRNAPTQNNFPRIFPDDVAFIQYTSGSTGNPKGVQLTHANLLTNMRQMITGMQISAQDIFVSWLPVYHDMGLILKTMIPFYLAAQVHLLPADLKSVKTWLKTIHEQRATFTAAPDFAYRLCLRHLVVLRKYDLTSLRVALNAAEPVRAATITDFEKAFGLVNVMVAGYGLAEGTVGVSMWTPQTAARVDERGLVSVGKPFPDVSILILKDGKAARTGEVGEIMIRSTANTIGYLNNLNATNALFWKDGYLHSGDLGYLDGEGCLFIVGRKKNTIKHAGETIAPQEIEETVDAIASVRYSAAVGIDRGRLEGEQAFIFAELRRDAITDELGYELSIQIVQAIHDRLGFHPGRVLLVKPHSIPKTYNGKIQHARLRQFYLDGSLREQGLILYPDY
jgi:acyl-CoA synthetase (AMP-forming)/AMP-acid ligase II